MLHLRLRVLEEINEVLDELRSEYFMLECLLLWCCRLLIGFHLLDYLKE